jgi:hypothetical protein
VYISAEIIAEEFSRLTMIDMAQMDIPTNADIESQTKAIEAQAKEITKGVEQAKANPQAQAMAQQNPDAAKQLIQQAQAQLQELSQQAQKLQETPTIEDVLDFLKNEKLRPFVLDIETDSTIYPDEMAEKASRAEFLDAFSRSMQGMVQLASLGEQAMALAGGVFKFSLAPYRVGRELEGLIDDFVDSAPQIAEQMQAANKDGSADALAKANQTIADAKMKEVEVKGMAAQANAQMQVQKLQLDAATAQADNKTATNKLMLEVKKLQDQNLLIEAQTQLVYAEIEALRTRAPIEAAKVAQKGQVDGAWVNLEAQKQQMDAVKTAHEIDMAHKEHALATADTAARHQMGNRQQSHTEASSNRSMSLAEQQAAKDRANGPE